MKIMPWLFLAALIVPLAACGVKGGLKRPSEIAREEEKKAKKAEEKTMEKEAPPPQGVP